MADFAALNDHAQSVPLSILASNVPGPATSVIVRSSQENLSAQVAFLPMWTGVPT